MGSSVRSLAPEHAVIEARFFGRVTHEDLDDAFGTCLEFALAQDVWHLMADCSDLVWSVEMSDLKEFVEGLSALGVKDRFREALVQPTDLTARVYVNFWETAGVNRGLDMRTFRTRDEALVWLDS